MSDSLASFCLPGRASAIVGGQFGSEAKGLAAGIVAKYMQLEEDDVIYTTNAGAQAGHTTVLEDGRKFVCYHLPTAGVLRPKGTIYLNAGSIINPELLHREVMDICDVTGEAPLRLMQRIAIHPNAAVINESHIAKEGELTTHLGSTRKGVGAALADKIMRVPGSIAVDDNYLNQAFDIRKIDLVWEMVKNDMSVLIEIPQGTGLSVNSQFWPKCTSRECWVGQGLTDAGIHPSFLLNTLMVQRTFPIRVGHIYGEDGEIQGNSGPFYHDSEELDWAMHLPGVTPEITTVTKRRRRIATFSVQQYWDACLLNQPTHVLSTFMNYLADLDDRMGFKEELYYEDRRLKQKPHHIFSHGPKVSDTEF